MDTITLELGHYQLHEQIAGSAYGVIWRASGPHGTGDVALKLVNQAQMSRALPALRERWIASAASEIAFLQSLEPWDERHIVRLLDSGWHEGLPVLALELLDGDLARHMASAPPPPLQAFRWTAQLNQALAKVHQYGWRYLDLKPANVLVDTRLGAVKLADFGTNRRLESLHAHTYSGTANWQAPEQFFPRRGAAMPPACRATISLWGPCATTSSPAASRFPIAPLAGRLTANASPTGPQPSSPRTAAFHPRYSPKRRRASSATCLLLRAARPCRCCAACSRSLRTTGPATRSRSAASSPPSSRYSTGQTRPVRTPPPRRWRTSAARQS
ncbi:protein kinase [Pseudoduganella sp. UC29_106]|uniref:protein kinase domain-containing protein n=1 Tax=Pseudoduganella sp. UC29_106 TaxID=3374553 RepID=UPI0037569461